METSAALKRFRKDFRLSQREVAAAWNSTPQAYQMYEYGNVSPSVEVIKKIAQAFNVTADYLIGLSDEPRPTKMDEKTLRATQEFQEAARRFVVEVGLADGHLQNHQSA